LPGLLEIVKLNGVTIFLGSGYTTGSGLLVLNAIQLVNRLFARLYRIFSGTLTLTRKRYNEIRSQ